MTKDARTSRLRDAREQRGLTQSALAAAADISRQTLYSIEAGRTEPAVSIAMRLARALDRSVEDLFGSTGEAASVEATLASDAEATEVGRVALTLIRDRWIAHALSPGRPDSMFRAAGGIAFGGARARSVQVELLQPADQTRDTVVLAGCAPALGVLSDRLNARPGPGRFLWLQRSSTAALEAFERDHVHAAGVHMRERPDAQPNVSAVRRKVPDRDVVLIRLAEWAAGLVVRNGNPLRIRTIADLARPKLRIAAREPGSGARLLLERHLRSASLSPKSVLRDALVVDGHFEVARAISFGAADVGLAMEGAALAHDLDFIALADECFDLVLARDSLDDPRIVRLLDAMNSAVFRRELGSLGGYQGSGCGSTAAELSATQPPRS